jgi:hypothetical protein
VRFQTTPRFDADFKRLKAEHKRQFRERIEDFTKACDDYATSRAEGHAYTWPATLRVRPMVSASGIWEMTWNFSSPDGRATFEFVTDPQGPIVRWRRIGDHAIFRQP